MAAGRFKADWNYKNVNESISDTCYKILFILWKCRFSFQQSYAYFMKTVVSMHECSWRSSMWIQNDMKIIQKLQNAIIWSCCRVEPSLFYIFSIYPYPSNFLLLFHPTTIFWLMVESRPQGLCNFCTWPEPISISCTFK